MTACASTVKSLFFFRRPRYSAKATFDGGENAMYPRSRRLTFQRGVIGCPALHDEKVGYPFLYSNETITLIAGSIRWIFRPSRRLFQFDRSSSPNLFEWARGRKSSLISLDFTSVSSGRLTRQKHNSRSDQPRRIL